MDLRIVQSMCVHNFALLHITCVIWHTVCIWPCSVHLIHFFKQLSATDHIVLLAFYAKQYFATAYLTLLVSAALQNRVVHNEGSLQSPHSKFKNIGQFFDSLMGKYRHKGMHNLCLISKVCAHNFHNFCTLLWDSLFVGMKLQLGGKA